jgi:hypothetical protein
MVGPCLCGDPACGSCFPSGQVAVKCTSCDWRGKQCDLGYEPDDEASQDEGLFDPDGCPECGADVAPVDGDQPPEQASE